MEIMAIFICSFLMLRTLVSLVNLLSRQHLPDQEPVEYSKVSILIPARNEEARIGILLESLRRLNYPDFEVIVCNDHSSDNTEGILNWFSGEDARIHWFPGEKLPAGWLGKNFACHQLAQKASGKYLVFLDADVEISPDSIRKAVAYFQQKKLSLLSIFPQQKMQSLAEWATVPVMNWILQSLLPLILVQTTKNPSLAAANGQFMMFDAETYQLNQWHSKVRNQHVEDIRLARMIKSEGQKIAVLLGNNDVWCRMYTDLGDAVYGFSRNIHEYFGGQRLIMVLFWLTVCLGPFIVFYAWGAGFLIFFAALVVLNRLFIAGAAKQNMILSILTHPIQMTGFGVIVFLNLFRKIRKETEWKGRKIKL